MLRVISWGSIAIVVAVIVWIVAGSLLPMRSAPGSQSADGLDGRGIYAANCAVCHGARGEGPPDWKVQRPDTTFLPPPHDGSGHTWHHPDGQLFDIVKNGQQSSPGFKATMPAWKATLSDEQIVAVLGYIKTMWDPKMREYQATLSKSNPFPAGVAQDASGR